MSSATPDHDHAWSPGSNGVMQDLTTLAMMVKTRTEEARKAFDNKDYKKAHIIAKVHSKKSRTALHIHRATSDEVLQVLEYRWKKEINNATGDQSIIDDESAKSTAGMSPKELKAHQDHIQLHVEIRDREKWRAGALHGGWCYESMELEKKLSDTHYLVVRLEDLAEDAKNAREGKVKKDKKHAH